MEYIRFCNAKTASFHSLLWQHAGQGHGIARAINQLSFAKRDSSIVGYVGIHHQSTGRYLFFVDWVGFPSKADSLIVTLKNGRILDLPMSNCDLSYDTDVYYHAAIMLDEIGLTDGAEIKHIALGRKGMLVSGAHEPEEFVLPWIRQNNNNTSQELSSQSPTNVAPQTHAEDSENSR